MRMLDVRPRLCNDLLVNRWQPEKSNPMVRLAKVDSTLSGLGTALTEFVQDVGLLTGLVKERKDARVHPIDAPPGTLRHRLLSLMTSLKSGAKRYATELVWELCSRDQEEFSLRAGFGNASHKLRIMVGGVGLDGVGLTK